VCARQVPCRVYYLDSRDCFLLLHAEDATLFLWAGRHAARSLLKATQAIAQRLLDAQPHLRFTSLTEGSEPAAFWKPFGRYASAPGANPDAAAGNALQGSGLEADAPAEEPPPSVTKPTTELIKERAQLEAALALEVKQASGWRVASGAQRTFMWRVRALGHGVSRVRMERSRGGVPLYSSLCSEAVLLLDSAVCLFVWVGEEAPEADETLAMQLAQQYTQVAARAGGVQVSHVLAGAEPDEFRRIFHGWIPWSTSPDPHSRRRDKLSRRLGLYGRVLRDVAWPGNPATDFHIAAEAAEEVLAGGLVVFSSSCGVLPETKCACRRGRQLLRTALLKAGGGTSFLEVDLATEPAEVPTLRLLLASNGVSDKSSSRMLPIVFLNGTLLAGGSRPTLQELQDDDALVGQLRVLQPKTVGMARQLPTLRMLDRSRRLHHGWLLKEGGVLRTQWKRRWCVLQPEGMYYFRAEGRNEDQIPNEDEPARGLIPILGASVRVLQTDFHFDWY
jgi:hypothetical protein